MGRIVLFLGGARSGKSASAERYAMQQPAPVVYVATAGAGDDEMRERIARHRARRPGSWRTIEAESEVDVALRAGERGSTVLLDSLTLLVSNLLLAHGVDAAAVLDDQLEALTGVARERDLLLIVVSDEVGMGVVPAYPLGRRYRDLLGHANQRVALAASEVYLVVAGIAVELRRLEAAFARRGP